MSTTAIGAELRESEAAPDEPAEQGVTTLELFFDLVFVFALTQVTGMLADDPTWRGLARGMLILAALWWAWVGYSWLTNAIDPEEVSSRLVIFAAMGAMLVVSLAVPGAFGEHALLFGVAYFLVRAIHVGLYLQAAKDLRGVVGRLAPFLLLGSSLLVVAAFLDGTAQGILWCVALAVDFGGGVIAGGTEGWRLSPGHFAERHGLIIIIALGESLVAIGVGASETVLDARVIVAVTLGIAAVAALWWAYFDVVAIVAERRLSEATGAAQAAMARDSYSFLHLPMIAGIVLLALGIKKTVAHVDDPLKLVPAVALCGGAALYLLAHVAFRLRNVRTWSWRRVVAAGVLLALIPVATEVDALVSLALVTGVCCAVIAYEAVRYREARARVRAA